VQAEKAICGTTDEHILIAYLIRKNIVETLRKGQYNWSVVLDCMLNSNRLQTVMVTVHAPFRDCI